MQFDQLKRRQFIALLGGAALPLTWPSSIGTALADDKNWRQGVSSFGDLKYTAGFRHFEYVNAAAPKGGTARQIAFGTFDSFNTVVAGIKGSLAAGIDLVYETLLVSSLDEISSGYGLLAEAISFPDDFSSVTYRLRAGTLRECRFSSPYLLASALSSYARLSPRSDGWPSWLTLATPSPC
jgi:microcin C transport system substrate-binding protein